MKLNSQDWRKLKAPLIILGIVIILIGMLIVGGQYYSAQQEKALKIQQSLLDTARQRYQSSGSEKDMITEYLPKYQNLINKGFVGEERRIEWVDALRAQHKEYKLFGIKYSISQQEDYKPSFVASLGSFVLHRSIMKLDLDMLHEGDILKLTESLAAKNITPFVLRDCEIMRLNSATIFNQLIPNLHANCELDWLTLLEPSSASVANAL